MYRRFIISILTFVLIIAVSAVTILYARGYKIDPGARGIVKTGFLSVNSWPDGAIIELDGRITDATNTTIQYLKPGTYRIKITRDGYLPWEKMVEVKEELVTEIDAILFPISPALRPLTFTGVVNPILSPDGNKIVYGVTSGRNAGLWVIDMRSRPFRSSRPQQIAKDTFLHQFSTATYSWSPRADQILVSVQEGGVAGEAARRTFLFDADRLNERLLDVTPTIYATIAQWDEERRLEEEARIAQLDPEVQEIISKAATMSASVDVKRSALPGTDSVIPATRLQAPGAPATGGQAEGRPESLQTDSEQVGVTGSVKRVLWSPNEKRFLFYPEDNPDTPYVYDLKEKKAFALNGVTGKLSWYPGEPDAAHLVHVENGTINIIEFDGENNTTVFTGQFDPAVVFPWPEGGQLVILTSFNVDGVQNLYALDLR